MPTDVVVKEGEDLDITIRTSADSVIVQLDIATRTDDPQPGGGDNW